MKNPSLMKWNGGGKATARQFFTPRFTMAAGSSSNSNTSRPNSHRILEYPSKSCWCGLVSPAIPSGTFKNFSRMFYGCPRFPSKDMCKFFEWADPEVCPYGVRAVKKFKTKCDKLNEEIDELIGGNYGLNEEIVGLNGEIHALKQEIDGLHRREKFLIRILVSVLVVILALLVRCIM